MGEQDVTELLAENGILPESPIGRVVVALVARIERIEQTARLDMPYEGSE